MPIHAPKTQESFSTCLQGRDCLPFDEYVKWALYDTEIGYYRREKQRVGKNHDSDFFTSSSLHSSVWGKLLIEASCSLIKQGDPADYVFVEIAAEPEKNPWVTYLILLRQPKLFD